MDKQEQELRLMHKRAQRWETDYEVVRVRLGNRSWYVQCSSIKFLKELLDNPLNFKFDSIEPSRLAFRNGIFKVWAVGELIDEIEKTLE